MLTFKVLITDHGYRNVDQEEAILRAAGAELTVAQCKTSAEVARHGAQADALLVQWAPVDAAAIAALQHCRIIVRYGIGVDNVDLAAAKARNIPVCNVPDYGVNEVAEHAVALALALARQLPFIDRRLHGGVWKIMPDRPMLALEQSTFATAGFGRIARAAHRMMASFGVKSIAYDPWVAAETMAAAGVEKVERAALFQRADLLSLHLPLTADTRHFVSEQDLATMKPTAILVNTARGPLIDTVALARALEAGVIAAAGVDVYEVEPVPADHPLLACSRALLTSHVAWYSESSIPRLQRLAAEEVVRGLKGEPLLNRVNR